MNLIGILFIIFKICHYPLLIKMNYKISIILVLFLFFYALIYFAFKKPLYRASFLFRERQSKFFSKLYAQLQYIKSVKRHSFENLRKSALKYQRVNYLFSGADGFVSTIAQIVLYMFGGIQILKGEFTIGMFTIFSSYFNMMINSSRFFFNLGSSYQETLVSYNRLTDIINEQEESTGAKRIESVDTIKIESLDFSYLDKRIINDFNLKFEKGSIYTAKVPR